VEGEERGGERRIVEEYGAKGREGRRSIAQECGGGRKRRRKENSGGVWKERNTRKENSGGEWKRVKKIT
jgi:hypothetical protein